MTFILTSVSWTLDMPISKWGKYCLDKKYSRQAARLEDRTEKASENHLSD